MDHPNGVWTTGARLITGSAGSGKTTLLVERYVELIRAGERGILLLVHSRRTARALADRILRRLGTPTDQVRVTTWHTFALSLLRQHHRALGYTAEPALLTGPEQAALVREMLAAPEEAGRWTEFRRHVRLVGFAAELREFVLRAQDALRSPEELAELARRAGRPALEEAASFFRRYLDQLDAQNVVDHANVIALAVKLLQDHPEVAAAVRTETRHLLADEYQDVTPAQEALLRELFSAGGSVCVAADPDARVFGFRGASPRAVEDFVTRFGAGVAREQLTEPCRPRPAAAAWLFEHLGDEAEAIAREVYRLRARDGTPWEQIAIVVRRYGGVTRALRRALERRGVPYLVVGENRALADEPVLRPLIDLVRAALGAGEEEERLPGILASPIVGLDPYEVRALRRAARLAGASLASFVAAPPPELPSRIASALQRVRTLFEALRARRDESAEGTFWFLWEQLDHFRDTVARGDADDLDAIVAFARAIERFSQRREGRTFSDYLDVIEGIEFGPEPWNVSEERRPDAVRILTAHAAIGMEFDAVVVAGCVEGAFPDPREPRAMIDIRDLLEPGTVLERRQARLAEERRLFGVAITRARTRLLLTAAHTSSMLEAQTPSPLVDLAGVAWAPAPEHEAALTRAEAESTARRTLRDTSRGEPDRREALGLLARLPELDPESWWYERDWTEGMPMVPGELRTSYSRMNTYDNCALQYLYQVELGLDPSTSHQMQVGSWVHDIVDRCARGDGAATEEALIAALDEVWDPAIFESAAIEHRRRIDCEEMLRRWLRKDGALDTLASEVAFEFPIDGAVMRGRIDRVVRLGGRSVRLIDYKTSRNSKRQDEVDEDLQLASYYLALKRDPHLASLGEPRYLELAFLGDFYQDGFMRRGLEPHKRPEYEQLAQQRLEGFVAGIKAERFAPSPGADCQWCSFKTLCPVWPEGDEVTL